MQLLAGRTCLQRSSLHASNFWPTFVQKSEHSSAISQILMQSNSSNATFKANNLRMFSDAASAASKNASCDPLMTKMAHSESLMDKVYRWMDITGFLTRWNNRKEWILDMDPYSRLSTPLITEYERKMVMFMGFHASVFFLITMYFALKAHEHCAVKPPCPKTGTFPGMDGRKKDFTWHGRIFFMQPKERCKECRWLELECKKECFERLKAEGQKLILNGGNPLSKPRDSLHPPHHH